MKFSKSKKLDYFDTGIFAALDEKKQRLISEGRKVYNLSIGTPDFKPFPHIIKALSEAAMNPSNYGYGLIDLPELLTAVSDYYKERYGVEGILPEEIVSVHGSQYGIGHLGIALCDPEDIVLLPNPGYPIFEAGSYLGSGKIHYYPLKEENAFLPVMEDIPEDILKKTKYMIVSYPLNPVGRCAPDSLYEKLIEYAKKYNFIIIHDNAYSDIIFDGRKGISFLSFPGAKEVGIEFLSLSKSYNLTGARISFAVGNKTVIDAIKFLKSQIDFGMFIPIQKAAAAALTGPRDEVLSQCKEYEKRRDALCGGLRKIGWNVPDSEGTMFVWAPLPPRFKSSFDFCDELMEKTGVIGTPGAAFGSLGEGYIRFALVKPVEELGEIVRVIDESGILK